MVPLVLILLAGYLIGGIPNSYLLVRLTKGIDLRTIGSGNVGATNACRVFQRPWSMVVFLVCFLLDAAKGYLPAHFLAPYLAHGPAGGLDPATHVLLIGLAAILGHVYTPYLGFKGGKGVATTLGVFLAAAPLALAIALGIGGILILATRYVSLGSIAMAVALPGVLIWRQPQSRVLCALAVIAGAVILYRHRGNMARLLRGTENKLFSPPRSTVKNDAP